mgnify:FL=1
MTPVPVGENDTCAHAPSAQTARAASLRGRGLVVGYGKGDPVLDGVDLDVLDAELTVIVGPNACGKSTLLRALARVLAVQGGEVLLDGTDIMRQGARRVARRLGMLPQSPTEIGRAHV